MRKLRPRETGYLAQSHTTCKDKSQVSVILEATILSPTVLMSTLWVLLRHALSMIQERGKEGRTTDEQPLRTRGFFFVGVKEEKMVLCQSQPISRGGHCGDPSRIRSQQQSPAHLREAHSRFGGHLLAHSLILLVYSQRPTELRACWVD